MLEEKPYNDLFNVSVRNDVENTLFRKLKKSCVKEAI
jgi:hypothetical protein